MSIPAYPEDTGQGVSAYGPDRTPWRPDDPPYWQAAETLGNAFGELVNQQRAFLGNRLQDLTAAGAPPEVTQDLYQRYADAEAAQTEVLRTFYEYAGTSGFEREAAEAEQRYWKSARRAMSIATGADHDPDQDEDDEEAGEDLGPWDDRADTELAATADPADILLARAVLAGLSQDELAAEVVARMPDEQKAGLLKLAQYPRSADVSWIRANGSWSQGGGGDYAAGLLAGPGPGGIMGYNAQQAPARMPRSKGVRRRRAAAEARARKRAAKARRARLSGERTRGLPGGGLVPFPAVAAWATGPCDQRTRGRRLPAARGWHRYVLTWMTW